MLLLMAGGVFFAAVVVYVLLMVFLPEWVGITGKSALNNQRSHKGEEGEDDSLTKFLKEENKR